MSQFPLMQLIHGMYLDDTVRFARNIAVLHLLKSYAIYLIEGKLLYALSIEFRQSSYFNRAKR